jgi:hypothetical protein
MENNYEGKTKMLNAKEAKEIASSYINYDDALIKILDAVNKNAELGKYSCTISVENSKGLGGDFWCMGLVQKLSSLGYSAGFKQDTYGSYLQISWK